MAKEKLTKDPDGCSNEFNQDNLQSLVQKSIALSEQIFEQNKKIEKRLRRIIWGSYIRLGIIIIPIIIGIIYLPPYFSQIIEQYKSILGISSDNPLGQISNISSSGQLKDIINLLK